jgi:hypothetical protein
MAEVKGVLAVGVSWNANAIIHTFELPGSRRSLTRFVSKMTGAFLRCGFGLHTKFVLRRLEAAGKSTRVVLA